MRVLTLICLLLLGVFSCQTNRRLPAQVSIPTAEQPMTPADVAAPTDAPAQAQTSGEASLPATDKPFQAASVLAKAKKPTPSPTEAVASTERRLLAPVLQKQLALPKMAIKAAEKQFSRITKKRPAGDNSILGLRPLLFFALLAVLTGLILIFVTGKSQFFSILTVVLLIGGLLVSLGAFLDLI